MIWTKLICLMSKLTSSIVSGLKILIKTFTFLDWQMKHTLGIRDQKGWNQCPEWGPGTKVGVPEKGKIKKNLKSFLNHF